MFPTNVLQALQFERHLNMWMLFCFLKICARVAVVFVCCSSNFELQVYKVYRKVRWRQGGDEHLNSTCDRFCSVTNTCLYLPVHNEMKWRRKITYAPTTHCKVTRRANLWRYFYYKPAVICDKKAHELYKSKYKLGVRCSQSSPVQMQPTMPIHSGLQGHTKIPEVGASCTDARKWQWTDTTHSSFLCGTRNASMTLVHLYASLFYSGNVLEHNSFKVKHVTVAKAAPKKLNRLLKDFCSCQESSWSPATRSWNLSEYYYSSYLSPHASLTTANCLWKLLHEEMQSELVLFW